MNILEQFDHQGKTQNKEHFINLLQIALADGKIDDKESEMLHRYGKKMGFTDPEIDNLISSSSKSAYIPPYEYSKRFEQVYDFARMILADGIIEENEMRFASHFASKSGFKEKEIPILLEHLVKGIKLNIDEDDLFDSYKKIRKL